MQQTDWSGLGDAELIAFIKAGKLGAFTALVDRHQRSLINFFYHLGWDRQVAEDCAQEVFLRLHKHLATYEPEAKFTTFLYRVARNLWIDRLRSAAVHGKVVSLEATGGPGEERTLRERVSSGGPSPVDILSRRETEASLKRAIDLLPEEQKAVLVLSEMQQLKYQDIAAILEIPIGTVKSRMHTAMEKLKEMMAGEEL
jgi:RNA polymerase sigma-70 factor, ECF subfamily